METSSVFDGLTDEEISAWEADTIAEFEALGVLPDERGEFHG
jgi:hypothetical protein